MALRSPTDPIILSKEDCDWLEKEMKKNDKRNVLTKAEKKLTEDLGNIELRVS